MVSQNSKILVVLNLGYSIRWVKVEELERRGCESRGVYDDKDDGCGGSLCSPGFESGIPQPSFLEVQKIPKNIKKKEKKFFLHQTTSSAGLSLVTLLEGTFYYLIVKYRYKHSFLKDCSYKNSLRTSKFVKP